MLSAKLLNFVVLSFALFISFAVAAGGKKARLGVGRNGDPLPDLYTATIDDLKDGLMAGAFTSADLVSVNFCLTYHSCYKSKRLTGLPVENQRSQFDSARRH